MIRFIGKPWKHWKQVSQSYHRVAVSPSRMRRPEFIDSERSSALAWLTFTALACFPMFTSRSTPIAILVFSIVLAFGIKRYYGDQDPPMILESHLGPSTPIASYVSSDSSPCSWERIAPSRDLLSSRSPDTTAVILNWSRLPNVKRIASLLCGSYLDGTIATVYIWNNSPHKLSERVRILYSC